MKHRELPNADTVATGIGNRLENGDWSKQVNRIAPIAAPIHVLTYWTAGESVILNWYFLNSNAIAIWSISCEITLWWMPQDFANE